MKYQPGARQRRAKVGASAPRYATYMKTMNNKAMWKCPKCGHRFVRPNRSHSCGNYKISDHFKGKSETLRRIFATFKSYIGEYGPVTVYAQKTGIIFHLRHRFALVIIRKNWIDIALCLWKPRKHPTLRKIEYFGGTCHRHWFRITGISDMDSAFLKVLKESSEVGKGTGCHTKRCN